MWALQGITVGGPSQEVREVTVVAGCGASRHAEAASASESCPRPANRVSPKLRAVSPRLFAEPLPDAG
jgi:hypothetical protein